MKKVKVRGWGNALRITGGSNEVFKEIFDENPLNDIAPAFDFLTINKDGKFKSTSIGASKMVIQPGVSGCEVDYLGGIRMRKELSGEPTKTHVAVKFCEDDLLDTCFSNAYTWMPNGELRLDRAVLNDVVSLLHNGVYGGMLLTLIAGQHYKAKDVSASTSESVEEIKRFKKTVESHKGLLRMLRDGATSVNPAWNVPGLYSASAHDGKRYQGDVVKDIFEGLFDSASSAMQDSLMGSPEDFVFVVDSATYARLLQQEQSQCSNPLNPCKPRIERRNVGGKSVLYIDGVAVRKLSDATYYDQFIGKMTRFAAITEQKNLLLGGSVRPREDGMMKLFYKEESGIYMLKADYLLYNGVRNSDMVVATQGVFTIK